eukprot:4823624-Lingulodinium_polyedra.AAC.1
MKLARRDLLPADTFFAFRHISAAADALILEGNGPALYQRYWPLCSQMLALNGNRMLVYTDAGYDTWMEVMTQNLRDAPDNMATRLKCRPSFHGGRVLAAPAATPGT